MEGNGRGLIKVQSQYLPRETEENHENRSQDIQSLAEI
jgi:hypothetical protein